VSGHEASDGHEASGETRGVERLFVALPLPESVTRALVSLQPAPADGIRLTGPEDMHLTLHFLGSAEPATVSRALRGVECPPFTARLTSAGHFSLRGGRKILWVGLEPTAPLVELHARLGAALESAGFATEQRPYVPHVTLARLAPQAPRGLAETFERQEVPHAAREFECAGFALFASEAAPDGARYRVLETYALEPGDPAPGP